MRTVCEDLYSMYRTTDGACVLRRHTVVHEREAAEILRTAMNRGRVSVGRRLGSRDEAVCVVLGTDFIREHCLTFREAV